MHDNGAIGLYGSSWNFFYSCHVKFII